MRDKPSEEAKMNAAAASIVNNDGNARDDEDQPTPLIRKIGSKTAQRLVAGQAITDLSSAVKELVDNAIDAGAGRVCSESDRFLERTASLAILHLIYLPNMISLFCVRTTRC